MRKIKAKIMIYEQKVCTETGLLLINSKGGKVFPQN